MELSDTKLRCPCCRRKLILQYSEMSRLLNVKCPEKNCGWEHNFLGGGTIRQDDVDFQHLIEKERLMEIKGC